MNPDYKSVFRRLEATLRDIAEGRDLPETLERLLAAITAGFGGELGVRTARIYRLDDDETGYELVRQVGPVSAPALGYHIPLAYAPVQVLREEGFVYMEEGDPGLDPAIEATLEAGRFAAITVGEGSPYLVAFTLDESFDPERLIYSLNTIRHVLRLKLRHAALSEAVRESRRIQLSLLPRQDPDFEPFEIHGRSLPAEEVGGDLFDFLPISSKMLAVTVADASGHGLPAALQARDAIIGLRMGLEDRFKLIWTMEKLNRVIARSTLSSRFISLFAAELERNGNLIYCNAGHPPGLLLREGKVARLRRGGLVLGVHPGAAYERGFVTLRPGSALLLYTDGLTEALSPGGEPFGEARLVRTFREHRDEPARAIVDQIFERVHEFSRGARADDQTAVIIRRHGS